MRYLSSILICCLFTWANLSSAQDGLSREASWRIPDTTQFQEQVIAWLDHERVGEDIQQSLLVLVNNRLEVERIPDRFELVLDIIQSVKPEYEAVRKAASQPRRELELPDFSSVFGNPREHPFVTNHTRLLAGRWFAHNEMYDEALGELKKLSVNDVLDPATLLFCKALAEHQVLKKEQCLASISLLLENEPALPRRYQIVGKLMAADLRPMKKDSLDEVARIMNDIRRRQALYRSGKIVRSQEEEVIQKLDKLIEELEAQRQQQMSQSGGGSNASSPMQDSNPAGGLGSGDITNKNILEGGDWGNLPPAERAAALAEMAKDLPPHYRAVIEEYFRQLAKDEDQ